MLGFADHGGLVPPRGGKRARHQGGNSAPEAHRSKRAMLCGFSLREGWRPCAFGDASTSSSYVSSLSALALASQPHSHSSSSKRRAPAPRHGSVLPCVRSAPRSLPAPGSVHHAGRGWSRSPCETPPRLRDREAVRETPMAPPQSARLAIPLSAYRAVGAHGRRTTWFMVPRRAAVAGRPASGLARPWTTPAAGAGGLARRNLGGSRLERPSSDPIPRRKSPGRVHVSGGGRVPPSDAEVKTTMVEGGHPSALSVPAAPDGVDASRSACT